MFKLIQICTCLVLFATLTKDVGAQKQNNIWLIGNNLGIDFNNVPPSTFGNTPLRSLFPTFTSSICNRNGELLFYTNGDTIWNRSNEVLQKMNNWWPFYDYKMPLLTTYPGCDSLYYLFCIAKSDYQIKAVVLNARANGGRGEIVYKLNATYHTFYTPLLSDASLMVAGTGHCNQQDIWIVGNAGSSLYSYKVTSNGIETTPVVSAFSSYDLPPEHYSRGNMKFSANGEKLFMPLLKDEFDNRMVVFDFDNLTGKFSHPVLLTLPANHFLGDGEISPDGSKLYYDAFVIDEDRELHWIYQMDLNEGEAHAVEKSAVVISPYTEISGCGHLCFLIHRSIQLGPNGRIYLTVQDNTSKVHEIEEPNQKGAASTYNLRRLVFGNAVNSVNYNFVRSFTYTPKAFAIDVKKANCQDKPVSFAILFKHIDSVKWNFGDPASGFNNFSNLKIPQHLFPAPGKYNVTAIVYHRCFVDTATTMVTILPDAVVKIPMSLKDTVVCQGMDLVMNATTPFGKSYYWNDNGSTLPQKQVSFGNTYTVRVQNDCSMESRTFSVGFKVCPCNISIPNAFTPNNDRLNDIFRPMVDCFVKNYRFSIFSRMGNQIFSTTDPGSGWDGKSGRADAESGTYVYLLTYLDPGKRLVFRKYGTVVLIR